MPEVPKKTTLPTVVETDLTAVLFEDIIDADHSQRFERLASQNPRLLQEVAARAINDAYALHRIPGESAIGAVEMQKIIIDSVTYALGALEEALEREANVAAYVVDQLRSGEPDNDQPFV